ARPSTADRRHSETDLAFRRALRAANEQENRTYSSGNDGRVAAISLARQRSGATKLYRTRRNSFSPRGIASSNIGTGALGFFATAQFSAPRTCASTAGSYPPCTGGEQLGSRRPEWCRRATRHETNNVGHQDAKASHKSTGCLSWRHSQQRCYARLSSAKRTL